MASTAPSPAHKGDTNVKETVESILIAFILAFIFRCFVIEAFVIPTGSMAPTLLGAHMLFRCPDCGYRFTTGYTDRDSTFAAPAAVSKVYSVICPNCGLRLPRALPNDDANDATDPTVRYGDRILVMKYLYLLHPPRRWDVVVFKTPDNRDNPDDYTVNYIKRLIGRPGERLFVAEGDLFVAPDTGKEPVAADFVVQPKPRPAQDALWRVVYDADYVPVGLSRTYQNANGSPFVDRPWQQPWQPAGGSGWTNAAGGEAGKGRQFVFDNAAGAGTLAFDPYANANTAALTDWLAYDQTGDQLLNIHDSLAQPSYGVPRDRIVKAVPDLKVSFSVDRLSGEGVVRAVLGKDHDATFVAEVSHGTVRLLKQIGDSRREIGQASLPRGRALLSLESVDYRVAVCVNGVERIATTPADYAPNVAEIVSRAEAGQPGPGGTCRIEAERCQAALSHVRLWRDVYYRDTDPQIVRGTAHNFPSRVVRLGADEYFTMGDNSYQSSDGRYWNSPVDLKDEDLKVQAGVVPGRFLLGKAFFVYWPAGFRAYPGTWPLVPNFGDMRFIR